MELFVSIMTDMIHFAKILILCNMFLGFHKREAEHSKLKLMCVGLVIAVTSGIIFVLDNNIIEALIYVIVIIALIFMLYKEKIYYVVIVTVGILIALAMIDTMTFVLADISLGIFNINSEVASDLISAVISLVLIYAVGRVCKKNILLTLKTIGCANYIGLTVLLVIDTFVVGVIVKQPFLDSYITDKKNLYLIAVVFVIIGIFIQLAAVIILFAQRNILKEKEQLADAYLGVQKNHYEYLETREKETKKFRHDLRNHMELISNLARHKEYDKIDEYLEQMNMKIDTFGNIVTVHNGMVDAIINQYYMKARQNGVNMKVEGKFPVDCSIEAYDLCTIFSNVLSNAYEAAMEAEDKYISLVCGYTERNIIIAVENSCRKETSNEGGFWRTKKDNADYHGYGLENIKDTVKKYDGVFDIEIIDNICMLKISFNHKEEPEGE